MKRTFGFLVTAFGILLFATVLLIFIPSAQLAKVPPESKLKPYTEAEQRGRDAYVSLGCVYCHSQQPRDPSFGPDAKKGWGRASTPGDYAYDYPHLLGTMRTGPDLLNIGSRQPSRTWHMTHLYQPRAVVPWSIMPSYTFLFEQKDKAAGDDEVLMLPPELQPKMGVLVAKPMAKDLVSYLVALKRDYPSDQLSSSKVDSGKDLK